MNLVHDWKRILRKAWVIRWIIAAGLLSCLETACALLPIKDGFALVPYIGLKIPQGLFAGLSAIFAGGAVVARVMAQPKMYEPDARTDPLDVRINTIGRRK